MSTDGPVRKQQKVINSRALALTSGAPLPEQMHKPTTEYALRQYMSTPGMLRTQQFVDVGMTHVYTETMSSHICCSPCGGQSQNRVIGQHDRNNKLIQSQVLFSD